MSVENRLRCLTESLNVVLTGEHNSPALLAPFARGLRVRNMVRNGDVACRDRSVTNSLLLLCSEPAERRVLGHEYLVLGIEHHIPVAVGLPLSDPIALKLDSTPRSEPSATIASSSAMVELTGSAPIASSIEAWRPDSSAQNFAPSRSAAVRNGGPFSSHAKG